MADANIRINIETSSLEQLNAELSALQAQIAKVPVGSAEFKRLSAEIRRVDGAVESASKKLKSLDVGAVAGDVAKLGGAVASASALFKQFGTEGSSSQEAVQKALETTNTILGAGAIAEGVASAARLAGVAATKAASAAQAAYSVVVGTSTGALKAFRIALASTGIGLIVVALGALVANWDKLTEAIGGSTKSNKEFQDENEKLIAQLDKQNARLNTNIERQRALGEDEAELLRQRTVENEKFAEKLAERQKEAIDRVVAANSAVRKENSESNRKELEEANKASDDLLAEQEKYEKEREVIRRDGLNLRLKSLDFEREKAILAAKKTGQDTLTIEIQFGQRKLEELKKSNIASKEEIERQEFEIAKIQEEARQNAIRKAEEAAQKRRATLKSEIDAVVNIIKEADRDVQLAVLSAEQKTITQGLDNIINKTKTFTQVLAELRKEGQGPYADFINNLFKSGKTYQEIAKIINDSFSKQKAQVIGEFFETGTEAIKGRFDELLNSIGEFENKYQTFIDDFRTKTNAFIESFQGEAKKPVLFSFTPASLFPPIDEIKTKFEEIQAEADKFLEDSKTNLTALKTAGKITEDELNKSLEVIKKLGEEFNKEIKKGKDETVKNLLDTSSSLIQEVISEAQATAQDEINKLETELYEELYFSDRKSKAERIKLEKTFQVEKNIILGNAIQQEIDLLEKQQSDIKELQKKGIITEQEAADKVLEVQRKVNALKLQAVKLDKELEDNTIIIELGGLTPEQLAERAEAFLQVLEKIKEAYALITGSIQAIGNLLADQAALQDLRFQEEIQKVQELYDERFKLIDEEEKKLDDLEQAKDNKISATERKRRALAKERAGLEAQQAEELAQLEADRANAAADAAIKQAEVNFALAVGQIVISTAEAVAKSIATSPQTFGLPFSAFAVAQGALQLAAANSARQVAIAQAEASRPGVSGAKNVRVSRAEGGIVTGPGNSVSDSIPANLSNGEFVVNANATRQFLPLLNQINQSGLQGGNPVNASGFSDPAMLALLERIDQKLAQPNRSYVVYNDIENIQNKQNYINRRSNVL